jgi:hypothetical protein
LDFGTAFAIRFHVQTFFREARHTSFPPQDWDVLLGSFVWGFWN